MWAQRRARGAVNALRGNPAVVAEPAWQPVTGYVEAPRRSRWLGEISTQAVGTAAADLVRGAAQAQALLGGQVPQSDRQGILDDRGFGARTRRHPAGDV